MAATQESGDERPKGERGSGSVALNSPERPENSPERPDTGWTDNNVVTGRQAAGCSAGNRRAQSRDWLASQDRAGDACGRLHRKRRMTMAGRMRRVVAARGGNRTRYEAGRQAKKKKHEKKPSHQTSPLLLFSLLSTKLCAQSFAGAQSVLAPRYSLQPR